LAPPDSVPVARIGQGVDDRALLLTQPQSVLIESANLRSSPRHERIGERADREAKSPLNIERRSKMYKGQLKAALAPESH
jgi:hypothetical protein